MQNINYDVLNTLNLFSATLGDAYLTEGYNPFDASYALTEENTEKLLQISKQKREIKLENFLEQSNSEISKNFEFALKNTQEILTELELNKTANKKDAIIFLKNRIKLLNNAILKLKSKTANAFELYKEIFAQNVEYSEILKQSFYEEFNKQITIQNFLKLLGENYIKPIKIEPKQKAQAKPQVLLAKSNVKTTTKEILKDLPPRKQIAKKPTKEIIKEN